MEDLGGIQSPYGLSSKHAPRNVKVPRMPYAGLEYVRKLMKRKTWLPHNGDGALHTGDGESERISAGRSE